MRYYKRFNKNQRGTFKYWFWHWLAFNDTAKKYKVWRVHHLFHDIEKPFLRVFLPYEDVQRIHRRNNKHHLEYKNPNKRNWEDMVIDWECSHLTKKACPRDAIEEAMYKYKKEEMTWEDYCQFYSVWFKMIGGRC